ncbi:hypothetical protein EON64_17640 [archaeon]|nr:MAG: hypothetical protein EON64_17640 [archaeon]
MSMCVQICLAGNKSDLESKRAVQREEGQMLANEYGASTYCCMCSYHK